MRGGPRSFPQGSSCPVVLRILPRCFWFQVRGCHPLRPVFPVPFPCLPQSLLQSLPRGASHPGLGSSAFARRYSQNRCFFLFLRLLRCFSSPGSLPSPPYRAADTWSLSMWVPPFRDPWITGYLLLPTAFRSLSRLSSAPSARASSLCSFPLNLLLSWLHSVAASPAVFPFTGRTAVCFSVSLFLFLSVPSVPSSFSY